MQRPELPVHQTTPPDRSRRARGPPVHKSELRTTRRYVGVPTGFGCPAMGRELPAGCLQASVRIGMVRRGEEEGGHLRER